MNKTTKYIRAIKKAISIYGLENFLELHQDGCDNEDNPWRNELAALNEIKYVDCLMMCAYVKQNSINLNKVSDKTLFLIDETEDRKVLFLM